MPTLPTYRRRDWRGHLSEDLKGLGLKGDQPVISVHLSYEKNYAFVEGS
jgi:hypothetical protein